MKKGKFTTHHITFKLGPQLYTLLAKNIAKRMERESRCITLSEGLRLLLTEILKAEEEK